MTSLRTAVLLAAVLVGWATAEIVYPSPNKDENDSDFWLELGRKEIEEALEQPKLTNVAKNVILFLGDGMGITVNTAGRILKGQKQGNSGEEGYLVWERFPNIGLMKTYNLDKQVPDSAGTATAYLSGVKANFYTLGVNGKVKLDDCEASLIDDNRVKTVLDWAQDADKETGVVTTAQVSHATPGGLYAKSASRKWQCDTIMKKYKATSGCKDIARQLVEDEPGRNMKVIMGGGRQEMGAPLEEGAKPKCVRNDGRNLVEKWQQDRDAAGKTNAYVTNTRQLRDLDVEDTEYILGLFGDLHVPYEVDRNTTLDGTPHIKEMVEVAINRLNKHDKGFFLLVEGGRIDHGLHYGMPKRALEELVAFEEAVERALELVNLEETLIIVTADHSHVMTINGYPNRGNNILGLVETSDDVSDGLPFTTLMFTNGHGYNFTWDGHGVTRRNLTGIDTSDKNFEPLAAVPTYEGSETHGGEDVAAFALGPMAHLFHRVHEQTHVAHVMGYAACIGPYDDCDRPVRVPANVYETIRDQNREKRKGMSSATANGASFVVMTLAAVIQVVRGAIYC
ncbi:alkaline phosphatase-like [Palaemon carinicauda]|uniref:alkaline phosphatase-like n=1 Tax=Palaemon carinicauda TaxID=392227 RepID=UPI0035B6A935